MSVENQDERPIVHADSYLTLHYCIQILTGPAGGTVFANTFDGRPATLQLGTGQWSPGLEAALLGRTEGDVFGCTLEPEQAYGERNPALVQWVARELMTDLQNPEETYEPGDMVEFASPTSIRYAGVLKQWNDDSALFDFNHPLAGAQIRLDVHILGIL
ncbi:FKBP-type peptidyl-prolyl cis-trans isomerase SlpA [Paenalcaligenes hominis]|uniref:Peptidyl-prolyl cis-trans isomerase n=1 Tax=Paenalcaligenes hominis TaxID=643674 RepID=A0ABX0WPB4_9BURK|nr:FKBP-type peptidyl-prolyl cis-trans isomerase [Paenalcaligenes hominis]NJB63899.1 FKBP-type peptidyl-prolyl cis-trans isomerase SlpA [Paenalcaligenes hominis]GGE61521.1 peptidyl-prolyl cis-trans isomerase [Paenalcaligenes hominis]